MKSAVNLTMTPSGVEQNGWASVWVVPNSVNLTMTPSGVEQAVAHLKQIGDLV